jgi:hypothetical protein
MNLMSNDSNIFTNILTCHHCGKDFKTDTGFLSHKCEKMKRIEDSKSPVGQAAFILYELWFTTKKRTAPSMDSFINSKQYKPFMKFAEFVKKFKISETELFIKMMNDKGILPAHWTKDEMYTFYLEYLDRKLSPKKQAGITIKTIEKMSDVAECDIGEIFDILTGSEIIQLIRERKLSPWILLRSKKFMVKMELMTKEEQLILSQLVRFSYWKQKFESRAEDKLYMDKLVKELDL